ncbi:MAG: phospho-N-acetylmuramoyl-pentapeptide-transferase, partial [Proteobacteria bacterium]|nr:phospho-N-acetylmuramoyl-pentapeptide-transferase [Pseudomonadota bacterium]
LAHYNVVLRGLIAFLITFFAHLFCGKKFISFITVKNIAIQPIRAIGPKTHIVKQGTPTMGGVLIVLSFFLGVFLCADILFSKYIIWTMLVVLCFSCIGFADDFAKLKYKNHKGLSVKIRMLLQVFITLIFYYFALLPSNDSQDQIIINIPFCYGISSIIAHYLLTFFTISGSANATNLTDGLDGLLSMPFILVSFCLATASYLASNESHAIFYSQILYIKEAQELIIPLMAASGSCLAFLWYNCFPAKIFMGDSGSLALGALLGSVSVIIKQEIILFIAGGVFVIEVLSVILQVGSYKLRNKKRIFKMTPIHHHFEQIGMPETQIVVRFWIVSFVLCVLSVILLIS